MAVIWQPISTYKPGRLVLFWVDDGFAQYPVYGRRWEGGDDDRCIWDDNGYGYAGAAFWWADFTPPHGGRAAEAQPS